MEKKSSYTLLNIPKGPFDKIVDFIGEIESLKLIINKYLQQLLHRNKLFCLFCEFNNFNQKQELSIKEQYSHKFKFIDDDTRSYVLLIKSAHITECKNAIIFNKNNFIQGMKMSEFATNKRILESLSKDYNTNIFIKVSAFIYPYLELQHTVQSGSPSFISIWIYNIESHRLAFIYHMIKFEDNKLLRCYDGDRTAMIEYVISRLKIYSNGEKTRII